MKEREEEDECGQITPLPSATAHFAAAVTLDLFSSSADVAIYFLHLLMWQLPSRQPPPWTPCQCTLHSDFAMSSAGLDLTSFLKGWGRSGGFKRLGRSGSGGKGSW